jgi:spermidine synthase
MATASEGADPLGLSEEEVDRRIAGRGLSGLKFYNGAMHRAVFALPNFVRDMLAQPAEPITAASPPLDEEIGVHLGHRLVLEER